MPQNFEDLLLPLEHVDRVFSGGYLQVEQRIYGTTPRRQLREVVLVRDGVCVLAVTTEGTVPMVTQFRASVDRALTELPAGVVDPGESPLDAARRELSEEAGCVGGEWLHLRHYAQAEGFSTGWMDLYLCLGCTRGESHPDPGEELLLQFRPLASLLEELPFQDAKSMLGLLLARPHLEQRGLL